MSPRTDRLVNATAAATASVTERITDQVRETIDDVKPRLRGWMHAASAPLTLAAGVVLVVLSPNATTRVGSAVFATSALLLFTERHRAWVLLAIFGMHAGILLMGIPGFPIISLTCATGALLPEWFERGARGNAGSVAGRLGTS